MMNYNLNSKYLGDIYRMIYEKEKCSRQELSQALDLSLPTIAKYLDKLISENYIHDTDEFESTGGRKARILQCVSDARYALGIDITKNHLSLTLINLNLDIIKSKRMRLAFAESEEYFLRVKKEIKLILSENKYSSKLLGIGISLPAIIAKDQKLITYVKVINASKNIYYKFKDYINYPFLFFNDSNSAGLAESWKHCSSDPMLYISLSGSVGGANITNRDIYTGMNWQSCEFGHMTVVPNGKPCYCGQKGCLDSYCSANVLSNFTNGDLNVFFKELKEKDNIGYVYLFEEYMDYLAIAVSNLRMCYDCDIILGGTVGSYMADYIENFRQKVSLRNPLENDASYIKVCKYKTEAAAVGAAIYYINDFLQNFPNN